MIYIENTGDTEQMLTSFLDSLEHTSDICFEAKLERYHNQIKSIQSNIDKVEAKIKIETRPKPLKRLKRAKNRLINLKKHFHEFCRELIVCGWNSGFYDLSIIISTLMRILDKRGCLKLKKPGPAEGAEEGEEEEEDDDLNQYRFAIKKQNKFVAFKTTKLSFKDVMMFLGAGVPLRKFIQCFGDGEEFKSFFPYDRMTSPDDLKTPLEELVYEDFQSSLTGRNVLEEDGTRDTGLKNFDALVKMWRDKDMTTISDMLRYYNELDVRPMYKAVLKLIETFRKLSIPIFSFMTLPSAAWHYGMSRVTSPFHALPSYHEDVYHTMVGQILGGFASPLRLRECEVGVTMIKGSVCQAIEALDFNSLYPHILSQKLPCGPAMVRYAPNFELLTARSKLANSRIGIQFARWIEHNLQRSAKHAGNGQEVRIGGRYPVDVYIPETQQIFELHGCFYHHHTCRQPATEQEEQEAIKKRQEDREKAEYIRSQGYEYNVTWECEFNRQIDSDPRLNTFLHSEQLAEDEEDDLQFTSCFGDGEHIDLDTILDKVASDEYFGFLMVDCHVPEDKIEDFQEFPVIIKAATLTVDDLTGGQAEFAKRHGYMKTPQRTVIGSNFAKNLLVISEQVKFWLEVGVKVTKVDALFEYEGRACMRNVIEDLVELRREGDVDPSQKPIADLAKLTMNSLYGRSLLRRDKFTQIHFCNKEDKDYLVQKSNFRSVEPLLKPDDSAFLTPDDPVMVEQQAAPDMIYAVQMNPKWVNVDMPVHLGLWVLAAAKVYNMRFYHQVLRVYLMACSFISLYCDTDSIFLGLTEKTIDDCVIPKKRTEWFSKVKPKWFVAESCKNCAPEYVAKKKDHKPWALKNCCRVENVRSKRTTGLMKTEFSATKFVGLSPKNYILESPDQTKTGMKGVQERFAGHLDREVFSRCLRETEPAFSENRGMMYKLGSVFSYRGTKRALNPVCGKRDVDPDDPAYTRTLNK